MPPTRLTLNVTHVCGDWFSVLLDIRADLMQLACAGWASSLTDVSGHSSIRPLPGGSDYRLTNRSCHCQRLRAASPDPYPLDVSQLQVCAVTGRTRLPTTFFDRRSHLVESAEPECQRQIVADVTTLHLQA